jgi:hypothetical protein
MQSFVAHGCATGIYLTVSADKAIAVPMLLCCVSLQGHISSDRGGAIAYVKFMEPEGAAAGLAANMMEVGGDQR